MVTCTNLCRHPLEHRVRVYIRYSPPRVQLASTRTALRFSVDDLIHRHAGVADAGQTRTADDWPTAQTDLTLRLNSHYGTRARKTDDGHQAADPYVFLLVPAPAAQWQNHLNGR